MQLTAAAAPQPPPRPVARRMATALCYRYHYRADCRSPLPMPNRPRRCCYYFRCWLRPRLYALSWTAEDDDLKPLLLLREDWLQEARLMAVAVLALMMPLQRMQITKDAE